MDIRVARKACARHSKVKSVILIPPRTIDSSLQVWTVRSSTFEVITFIPFITYYVIVIYAVICNASSNSLGSTTLQPLLLKKGVSL